MQVGTVLENWYCFTRNLKVSSQKVRYFKKPDSMVNSIPMYQISVRIPKDEHDIKQIRDWCIVDLIYHAGLRNCELSRLQIRNFVQHEQALLLDNRFKRPRIVYLDQLTTHYLKKISKIITTSLWHAKRFKMQNFPCLRKKMVLQLQGMKFLK